MISHVDSAGFGLVRGRNDVLDGVENIIEGNVGHRLGYFLWVFVEDKPSCGAAAGFE